MTAPSEENLFVINLIWKHLLSTKWKFQSFGRRERCFHWNQNGKWQIVVIWEHSGAIFVYISWITCAPCKTSSDWIRVLVAVTNEILKRESSKCILDPPRAERRRTRTATLGQRRWVTVYKNRFYSNFFFQYACIESCQFRSCFVFFVSWHLICWADYFRCSRYYCDNGNIS